jgi:hypothetical protein
MCSRCITAGAIVFALAGSVEAVPTLSIVPGGSHANGRINANGDWVWRVEIAPSQAGAKLKTELGFRDTVSLSELKSVTSNMTEFDTPNPGTQICTWEVLTDVDPGPTEDLKAVGVQANCPAGCLVDGGTAGRINGNRDEIFTALGSIEFSTAGAKEYLTIVTEGPGTANGKTLQTNLQWLGKYGAGLANGRITEIIGGVETNYDTFAGSLNYVARSGDVNLDGESNGLDVTPFLLGWQKGTGKWFEGDLTGDGNINGFDGTELLNSWADLGSGSGTALSGVHAVPEPTAIWICAFAFGTLFVRHITRHR